jgi:hypothetical protein
MPAWNSAAPPGVEVQGVAIALRKALVAGRVLRRKPRSHQSRGPSNFRVPGAGAGGEPRDLEDVPLVEVSLAKTHPPRLMRAAGFARGQGMPGSWTGVGSRQSGVGVRRAHEGNRGARTVGWRAAWRKEGPGRGELVGLAQAARRI